jgi:hypothetical protein
MLVRWYTNLKNTLLCTVMKQIHMYVMYHVYKHEYKFTMIENSNKT